MRLWSLHPRYLDRPGLTGCWREALLAQAVLAGRTRGYRSHPQLLRFRRHADTPAAVGAYLAALADEAERRGYRFDRSRIDQPPAADRPRALTSIPVTESQVAYEWQHLLAKLAERSPDWYAGLSMQDPPQVHPLFEVVPGPIEDWERTSAASPTAPTAELP